MYHFHLLPLFITSSTLALTPPLNPINPPTTTIPTNTTTPNTTLTLTARGISESNFRSALIVHTHPRSNCVGDGTAYEAAYFVKYPYQVGSYHLNRDLLDGEHLELWNMDPKGGPIDVKFNGDLRTCTFKIRDAEGRGRKSGCTDLGKDPVGCVRLVND